MVMAASGLIVMMAGSDEKSAVEDIGEGETAVVGCVVATTTWFLPMKGDNQIQSSMVWLDSEDEVRSALVSYLFLVLEHPFGRSSGAQLRGSDEFDGAWWLRGC
ncbi:hypothetical protein F0562_003046 [Nyssa sinensis]|uniref:Uncharacterized protein n=1 Tax=Nyssa sinensis TaxID=561372 RepID=A0A5J5BTA8_9ASTE|nr:hypothetical protein F0562_003046 [Nyssa sinensis]